MALARVQASAKKTQANASSVVIAMATPPTVGNGLIVFVNAWKVGAFTGATCTDAHGNLYLRAVTRGNGNSNSGIFYCPRVIATGAPFNITVAAGTGIYWVGQAVEFSGVGAGLLVDQIVGATGSSAAPATGATPALTASEVIQVAAHGISATQGSITVAGATPTWSEEFQELPNTYLPGEANSRIVTSAAGTTPSCSWTDTASAAWSAVLATFSAGGAGDAVRVQRTPPVAGSATSYALTFPSPPVVGNAIVVLATKLAGSLATATVTDNQGNSYALVIQQPHTGPTPDSAGLWLCPAVAATGSPFTITVTHAASAATYAASAVEVAGPLVVDRTTSATGTSTAPAPGTTAALTAATVFVATAHVVATTQASIVVQAVTPVWNEEFGPDVSSNFRGEADTRTLTGVLGATTSSTWTISGAIEWAAVLAAFKTDVVTVPDVVGETEAAADTILIAAGLVTGTVTTAADPVVPAGQVISQSPAAGSSVAPGSAVDLVISTGPAGPPVYEIGIGETIIDPIRATFRIQETIDAPDTMIADVGSVGSPFFRATVGEPVYVTENGVRIFGGVVSGTRERGLSGPSATDLVVEIQATSYEIGAARRVITAAFSQGTPAETIGDAFASLVTDYYADVGVTIHPDQVAGPGLPAATFERTRGDAVNKQLAASVGYLQSIDFDNQLRAWAPGDVLAPDNYDETVNPELLIGDITVERQLQNGYANRVILVGNPIAVPDHRDDFTGDGTTDTWPITYQVTGPFPYFVDGAVAFGIVVETLSGATESIGGVEAPGGFLWEYDPIALTIHRRAGPVAAGVAFYFPYHGLFVPEGMAEDAGEIATYGLWEHVENVTAVITDASAQDYADALLAAKLASKDEIVTLQTHALGFHPGQTMTIVSPSRQLSGDYLISQVDTASDGSLWMRRSITASKSQGNTHDWRRVYQQWAGASAGASGGGAGSSPSSGAGAGLPILISASSLLGRGSAGAGSVEEITLSNSLIMTGTSLTVRTGIFEYVFNNSVTEPPSAGQIRLNTTFPWTTAAKLWLMFISSDDQDLYWGIMIIPAGAMVILQDKDDHTKYGQFTTTGAPIDKGTYAEIPIAHVANGTAITTAQRVFLRAVAT